MVLAAGRASRFGGGKLDARCAGKPVSLWVLEAIAAAGLAPGLCVTGPQVPAFLEEPSAAGWQPIINPRPEDGLACSLAVAAKAGEALGAEALLVVLADMPLVPPALLGALIAQPGPAATDHGAGRPGVPALIPRELFAAVAQATGDSGAARILAHQPGLVLLPAEADWLLDIDTLADLAQAENILANQR